MSDLSRLLENYARDGFVVVENCLTPEEVDDFLNDEPFGPAWTGGAQDLQRFRSEDHWRRLVSNDRVASIAERLLGAAPRAVEAIFLPKAPTGSELWAEAGIAFHRDVDHIRCDPPRLIGCWLALSDTDLENGGLCVAPGSQRQEPALLDEAQTRFKNSRIVNRMRDPDGREWTDEFDSNRFERLDLDEVVALRVPLGGAVFFDGRLVHGSFANLSADRPRLVASVHYVAEGSWVYRTDIQDTVAVSELHPGRVNSESSTTQKSSVPAAR